MWCNNNGGVLNYTYTNHITRGSTAAYPITTSTSSSISALPSSTLASPTTAPTILPSSSTQNPSAFTTSSTNNGLVAGIAVGSAVGVVALIGLFLLILRKRSKIKAEKYDIFQKDQRNEMAGGFDPSTNTSSTSLGPRKLSKPPGIRSAPVITTTHANDFLSPIQRERLAREAEARDAARDAARRVEIDGTPFTARYPSPEILNGTNTRDWWKPPTTPNVGKPSARWSVNAAQGGVYKAYQPNAIENRISELSHTIRQVQASGSLQPQNNISSATGTDQSSPVLPEDIVSPLIGYPSPALATANSFTMTPLMGKWNDRASVGQLTPKATVDGPLNWPDEVCIKPKTKSPVSRSLTNAHGGEHRWVSPESAIVEGFTASSEYSGDEMKD
jgi:hypothetical protein